VPDENPSGLGAFEFPLRFPGQYADKETNSSYNGERNYDSFIGRFTEYDLEGLNEGINQYAYVDSSPLEFIDVLGLAKKKPGKPDLEPASIGRGIAPSRSTGAEADRPLQIPMLGGVQRRSAGPVCPPGTLPKINWSKQERHLLGHAGFKPGRSELTTDPERLLQRAGTGQIISGTTKERVDFGEMIGIYVDDTTGQSLPTTKGIIHHSATGAHIVPARP
jgi:RHS repeat-associated protein